LQFIIHVFSLIFSLTFSANKRFVMIECGAQLYSSVELDFWRLGNQNGEL